MSPELAREDRQLQAEGCAPAFVLRGPQSSAVRETAILLLVFVQVCRETGCIPVSVLWFLHRASDPAAWARPIQDGAYL
jgi:hypothetical protein